MCVHCYNTYRTRIDYNAQETGDTLQLVEKAPQDSNDTDKTRYTLIHDVR